MTTQEQIWSVLKQYLTKKERKVLSLRFGLDDDQKRTLEEIGRELGVTRERVRQIETEALRKLRKPDPVSRLKHLHVFAGNAWLD